MFFIFLIGTCVDVDECTTGQHNCHLNANCINVPASFMCACKIGHTGNGTFCKGKTCRTPFDCPLSPFENSFLSTSVSCQAFNKLSLAFFLFNYRLCHAYAIKLHTACVLEVVQGRWACKAYACTNNTSAIVL